MKRNELLAPVFSSPREFVYLVEQIIENEDRRDQSRVAKRLALEVHMLTDDFTPTGCRFCAISSDISKCGMGFISDSSTGFDYVRIKLLEQDVSVIAKVRHCTSIGTQYPLYLTGVEFLEEYLV